MTDADGAHPGVLRPCRPDDDAPTTLDPDVARLHHRLRVEVAARLHAAVPDDWDVSAGCCWQPAPTEAALRPDVVVHRALAHDGRLRGAPVLCVDIAAGPPGPRAAHAYARLGVDHHWHVDTHHGAVQVSVRVDDAYRRCETFTAESLTSRVDPRGPAWVDFGVGIAHLDGLLTAPLITRLNV